MAARSSRSSRARRPGVQTQVHLFSGDPRERLLAEAEHARELVIGSRGLGGFHRDIAGYHQR